MKVLEDENDYDENMKKGWVAWLETWFCSKNYGFSPKPFLLRLTSHAWGKLFSYVRNPHPIRGMWP